MNLNLIWAQTRTGVIGDQGHLPWDIIPEDMHHFRDLTRGHAVIMGAHTWDSLPPKNRPLPGRRNIIITSRPAQYQGVETYATIDAALHAVKDEPQAWIIGGGQLYEATIDLADSLHITDIDLDLPGDTHAPDIEPHMWQPSPTSDTTWHTSRGGPRYRFTTYLPI